MPTPEVKEYPKTHLRAIIHNPSIDTSNETTLNSATKISKQRFLREVLPIVQSDCTKIITVDEFKKRKYVPREAVRKIFEKLKLERNT